MNKQTKLVPITKPTYCYYRDASQALGHDGGETHILDDEEGMCLYVDYRGPCISATEFPAGCPLADAALADTPWKPDQEEVDLVMSRAAVGRARAIQILRALEHLRYGRFCAEVRAESTAHTTTEGDDEGL